MGFGYLNLGDPASIGDNESQSAINCRFDRGYLEYVSWALTEQTKNRTFAHPSGAYSIDATFPAAGKIIRGASEVPGLPAPNVSSTTAAGVAYGSQLYPVGDYSWVFTYYDQTTGEEGPPSTPIFAHIAANQVGQFSSLPSYSKTSHTIVLRIYRMPLGGSEYLASALNGSNQDVTVDASLGGPVLTAGYQRPTYDGFFSNADQIVLFNGKMFFSLGDWLGYTVTDDIGFYKAEFLFEFGEEITDLLSHNEVLYIFTETKSFTLYGLDEEDFVLKEISPVIGACMRAGRIVNSIPIIGSTKKYTVTTVTPAASYNIGFVETIQRVSGSTLETISDKVKSLFPMCTNWFSSASDASFETGNLEERFWILKYSKLGSYSFATDTAMYAQMSAPLYLVYDTMANGFLRGDPYAYYPDTSTPAFIYKTKDFGSPDKVTQFKEGFVEYEGTLQLQITGDSNTPTTLNLSSATRTNVRFRVSPLRAHRFNFKFTGVSGTKVYSFGRID